MSDLREGKGGAPFFWAFFSPEKRAGAGDRPVRGTPKEKVFYRSNLMPCANGKLVV